MVRIWELMQQAVDTGIDTHLSFAFVGFEFDDTDKPLYQIYCPLAAACLMTPKAYMVKQAGQQTGFGTIYGALESVLTPEQLKASHTCPRCMGTYKTIKFVYHFRDAHSLPTTDIIAQLKELDV